MRYLVTGALAGLLGAVFEVKFRHPFAAVKACEANIEQARSEIKDSHERLATIENKLFETEEELEESVEQIQSITANADFWRRMNERPS